jgi:hypothetical protein
MADEHGVQKPSQSLYPPAAKKPKNKPKKKPGKTSAEEGTAGMKSMPGDGSCAYHLASMAIYGTSNLDVQDIDDWPAEVELGRTTVIENFYEMKGLFVEYLDTIPFGNRSDQLSHWESLISEEGDGESFVEHALDLTKWGGSVELAIAMENTTTCVIIVHADNISEQASEIDVEGSVQPAMLQGLSEGVSKTHNVFAILCKGHYYLGYVRTEGANRGLFKVGAESDAAKKLLIEFLKSTNSAARQRKRKRKSKSCISEDDESQENAFAKPPKKKRQRKPTAPSSDSSEFDEREEPKQDSCLSEDDESQENALAKPPKNKLTPERQRKPTAQSADRSESDEGEEKDCCNASNDESMDYDANQMVIYTHEDPKVLLVGSVIYVARYKGSKDEYLMLHRYGYASQGQAAWNLDYTKPFAPGYIDRKDDSYVFTFKPRKAWEKVEHHNVEPGNVKAKFVLNKKKVPPTALRGGGTAAVQQPVQVSDYELARGQRMKDNKAVMLSFGLVDLAQISIEHEPVKRAKTSKKNKSSEQGPRRASKRLAVCDVKPREPRTMKAAKMTKMKKMEDDEDEDEEED